MRDVACGRRRPFPTGLAAGILCLGIAVPASFAANGLTNPDFDAGVSSWSAFDGALDFDSGVDFDGCAGSGSALGSSPELVSGSWRLEIHSSGSCVPVTPGEVTYLTLLLRPGADIAATDFGLLTYTDANCTAGELEAPIAGFGVLPQLWLKFQLGSTIAPGALSARFYVRFADPTSSTYEVHLDRAYLGSGQPLFTDDFEPASTCRWDLPTP